MASQDEPLTPRVPIFLRPEFNTHCYFALGFQKAINVDALKSAITASPMLQIPRFCSVVVLDEKTGHVKGWRKLHRLDIDRHFVVVATETLQSGDTNAVNHYIAELAMNRTLGIEKPLWEIHVLLAHRCVVLWAHHAVGDGGSFMSLFETCFCTTNRENVKLLKKEISSTDGKSVKLHNRRDKRWKNIGFWWFSAKFIVEFSWKSLFSGDRKTDISGGAGVELWPRKLSTATFSIDDMKLVKLAVPNATINDVFFTIISAGLGRYLENRSGQNKGLAEGLRITCVCLANVRKKPGLWDVTDMNDEWGNKIGVLLLPIHCREAMTNPLEYLKSAGVILRKKKGSFEADFSNKIVNLAFSLFGVKFATRLTYKLLSNTTLTISNVVGPRTDMEIADNRVIDLKIGLSSLPQSLVVHLVSYHGKANLQILVAKDIIPDPEFLAKCFEDAMLELKQLVLADRDFSK